MALLHALQRWSLDLDGSRTGVKNGDMLLESRRIITGFQNEAQTWLNWHATGVDAELVARVQSHVDGLVRVADRFLGLYVWTPHEQKQSKLLMASIKEMRQLHRQIMKLTATDWSE